MLLDFWSFRISVVPKTLDAFSNLIGISRFPRIIETKDAITFLFNLAEHLLIVFSCCATQMAFLHVCSPLGEWFILNNKENH